jgi:Carboxypeptidase regulatory-like domain
MKNKSLMLLILMLAITCAAKAQQRDETASVRGRVTDLFGYGIEDATIQFFSRTWFKAPTEVKLVKSVTTDAQGNYTLDGLPYGYYIASVESRGFRYGEVSRVFLSTGENLLDMGLEVGALTDVPGIEISGTVLQTDKSPLIDATVTLMSAFDSEIACRTRTDKSGRYKFMVHTPSQYIIYASKEGFEVGAATTTGAAKAVNLVLAVLKSRQK